MKKYLLIATVALGLTLTACGGGQKAENTQPANDAAQPVVTATTDSVSVNQDSVAAPVDTTAAPAKQ